MPTDYWSDEDRPGPRRRGWRWWQVAALTLVPLLAAAAVLGSLFPRQVADRWIGLQARQLRGQILDGRLTPEQLRDHLRTREGGHHLALRLSRDEDPRVRAAAADAIAGWGNAPISRVAELVHMAVNTLSNAEDAEALGRLLDDPDPEVRRAALRAVSSIQEVRQFEDRVLRTLEAGPEAERVIVAEHLAHRNGPAARRTFADPRQPKEVRLAVLRGADRYWWEHVFGDGEEFVQIMDRVKGEADPDLSRAAANALARLGEMRVR